MKYPMIRKLELGINTHSDLEPFVWASDLEALLEKAPTIYGNVTPTKDSYPANWCTAHFDRDGEGYQNAKALLIAIEPFKRGVTKHDILMTIKGRGSVSLDKLANRIEAEGIIEG